MVAILAVRCRRWRVGRWSLPIALLRSHETVGNILDAKSSLGDLDNTLKGVVIPEIDSLTVHVQEDCRCQPSQTLVAINQRVVGHDRVQESSRFELDSRVGVLSEPLD